ncbi:T9SS type A sorting domain-containing protein [Adhaeribacter swui]|uniref:T9SS type A sorting domain-containing protein n=1 Tax=Adhaeribacter swui TaxID=2086471 RepID=A0A7G7GC87_9BACT|nr:T9SS type A sorting domain-containing protein [Adhaeribacter swui]QNF34771.1 T9SS type A sorting domain-containing protein [Adhaeribacter swui]
MNKALQILVISLCSLNLAAPVFASGLCSSNHKQTVATVAKVQEPTQEVKVYPNPTTGKLFISLQGFKQKPVQVQVINVIGNVVLQEKFYETEDQFTKTLELSKFNKGLYYVKLQADKYSEMRKVFLN